MGSNVKKMIITSGNFTINGLNNNHEWGLLTEDIDIVESAIEELFDGVGYPDITQSQIEKACAQSKHYSEINPDWGKKPEIISNILESVYSDKDAENLNPQYFLKPIGHSENPVTLESQRDFSKLHQNLHFSKKKPKGVKKGDIVITTAVGAGSLLSYFHVTGSLQHVSDAEIRNDSWTERWPWYMEGRNKSPEFGKSWWQYDLKRQDLLKDFRELYPDTCVTYAGGFTLGTINRGNDKVRITKEFGDFLIDKIKEC
ncbi:hypothetical protein JYT97_02080 [Haliea sp. AH-315-K21]|uniref:Uncharacterized protein n=1 Tax=SAR86 cluster bacterium TaxID=2030880 RepID=A0A2A5CDW2_9GAMM|nr:hypothetical protein [Haliea sp. AH-315-K21]PCJ42039.1 MAG: hypothetical protein COA71_05455 [SAR86 cluster bacterium]